MYNKFKSFLADDAIFIALLLILVGVVSFGLGRQSMIGEGGVKPAAWKEAGVTFTQTPINTNNLPSVITVGALSDTLVASKSGTKYHLLTCPGAKQIKEENKIYFDTTELAKAAGYTPAANCPDL